MFFTFSQRSDLEILLLRWIAPNFVIEQLSPATKPLCWLRITLKKIFVIVTLLLNNSLLLPSCSVDSEYRPKKSFSFLWSGQLTHYMSLNCFINNIGIIIFPQKWILISGKWVEYLQCIVWKLELLQIPSLTLLAWNLPGSCIMEIEDRWWFQQWCNEMKSHSEGRKVSFTYPGPLLEPGDKVFTPVIQI